MKISRFFSLCGVVLLLSFSSCGSDTPSAPVTAATPTPTPAPTATPTPAPTPTPTPSGPRPFGLACGAQPMENCSAPQGPAGVFGCCRSGGSDTFGEQVELAIREVQATNDALFDGDKLRNPGDGDLVMTLVVSTLERRFSLCAKGTSDDEIAVKRNNNLSEQFDIFIGDSVSLNVHGYVAACRPARF